MTPYRKKLIEVALPLEAINDASAREKSIRHGHPSTLHLWWARRPLAACRAVIFTSLVDDPDDPDAPPAFVEACRQLPAGKNAIANDTPRQRLFDFIERLVRWESTTDEKVLDTARHLIRLATDGNPPPLLDPFAGGGSIPLEAQRLGLEAHASDLNPVAVMINKALIEIPPRFAGRPPVNPRDREGTAHGASWQGAAGLAADVRYYGEWMRDRARERIGRLYPPYTGRGSAQMGADDQISENQRSSASHSGGETVIAWLWARTVKCPNPACGAQMPLVRSFDLSTKKSRRAWVEPHISPPPAGGRTGGGAKITFEVRQGQSKGKGPDGTVNRLGATCIACGTPVPFDHIRDEGKAGRMGAQLMAIVTEGTSGRSYYAPTPEHEQIARVAIPDNAPNTDLPEQALGFRVQLYGMTKHRDLFTPRQLVALTTFSDLVSEAREQVYRDVLAAGGAPPPQPSPSEGGSGSSPQRGEVRWGDSSPQRESPIWIPQPVPPQLLEAARRLRREMTDAEQLLWQCLRRKQLGGFRFRKQHPIERFVLDFYCPAARLAVELDGGQHNMPDDIASDEERTAILGQKYGIRVIRFWNNEVFANLEGVLQTIYETLLKRTSEDEPPPQPSPFGGGSSNSSPQRGEVGWGDDDVPLRDGGIGARAYAEAVSVYLGMAVSRQSNRMSTICFWDKGGENVQQTFARQALPMTWDFTEGNPFSNSTGSWLNNFDYISANLERLASEVIAGTVKQENAAQIQSTNNDLIINTDPPYYDNIGYADLSDYFYIWLRQSLNQTYPSLFSTLLVPKSEELIATPYRFKGSKNAAIAHFETGLKHTFAQIRRMISSEYPLAVYYAFKQQEAEDKEGIASTGWETMLNGLIETGFQVGGTWPMRTEQPGGLRVVGQNALASSIVLVCRPRPENAPMTSRRDFVNLLRGELPRALREMQSGNIAPVDLAQASIGPGMAVYSRYSKVLEPNGDRLTVRTALQLINQVLDEYLAEQEGHIDEPTRFAVAWFEQYGFNGGEFGVADVLARAKNTSVDGLANAGLLESGAGKVRLYRWEELDPGWDPSADARATAWEATHHLIERLNTYGEEGAARLLAKMSPDLAAEARQLAYRLYSICERKGWAEQARDYNALVVSWGASQEQARTFKEQLEQGQLF